LLEHQADLALTPPEIEPGDRDYPRSTKAWAQRMGNAVNAGVITADQAREAEKAVAAADDIAELPPLTGVPIPIKDLNMVAGVRQTLGSKAFETSVPDTDDYVVVNIKQAGAVITGKTATPDQAQEVHALIRETLAKLVGAETVETVRIQYGGSMKPSNAAELLAKKDIDGGLIGGAALKAADFAGIIEAAAKA
jgi:hypothetical protein